tara:strand:- start:1316 stop:1465 length:150 start_codon:yes stop_codon:yes gene_type:complete
MLRRKNKLKYELIWTRYGQYACCLYFSNKKDAFLFQKKHGGELFTCKKT